MARKLILTCIQQDLLEQDSSDEDDMEHVFLASMRPQEIANKQGIGRALEELIHSKRNTIKRYVEDIIPSYNDKEFVMHFRLKRGVARSLIMQFQASPEFTSLQDHGGFEAVSPEKHILSFLWFVGHEAASYRDVADRFDLSLSALHSVIKRITKFIVGMANTFIRDPTNEEMDATKLHYYRKGFPNVIGSIDGSHVRIDKPHEDPESYINRKKYFSMHIQAIVNERGKFFDVFIGYPGSVHDARVFKNSPIYEHLPTLCQGQGYLLGDSAYPCSACLITPYRDNGHLTRAQRKFNLVHSSCRITVEHSFGWLKQRFRQLYHLKLRNVVEMTQIIHACCVLHNIADLEDLDGFEQPITDDHPDRDAENFEALHGIAGIIDQIGDPVDAETGKVLRDELCRQIAMREVNV